MVKFASGTKIRLINDPGREGVVAGSPRKRAGKNYYRVQFRDGFSTHPEYEIEIVDDFEPDPFTLLERGTFGRGVDLRRQLTHIQLSGRLANLVYSMDTTNVDFYAYQYKPVLSFLESPAKGILIADEVGLGKTIEAGLIWTELRLRYDARRLLVVCPAMLREKWKIELQRRFSVQAEIMDAKQLLDELRINKGEIPDGKAIVCSMQGLRPPREKRDSDSVAQMRTPRARLAAYLKEEADAEPLVDLLIVDEAHHMRNPESQTAKLGQMLRDVSDHIILLSATPINLHSDDLYYLLNLVDPDTFYYKGLFPQVLGANEPLLKAQNAARNMEATETDIKENLERALHKSLLKGNRQLESMLKEDLSPLLESTSGRVSLANRIEKINLLRHVLTRTRKVDVNEWRVVRRPETIDVEMTEVENDMYQRVTESIRQYAVDECMSDGFLLATPQRQMSSCMYAAVVSWKKRCNYPSLDQSIEEQIYEDFGLDNENLDNNYDVSPLLECIAEDVLPHVDADELREYDSKYHEFSKAIRNYLNENPTEKVVVFSFFRGTLKYLSSRLVEEGVSNEILMGGVKGSKQEIIDNFRDNPDLRVLLASEVACEGVDIQFCRVLINYDLPWNPMKVDQRIGRIDRIGQTAETISILNICYAGTIDQRIHNRLLMRLNIFERALGGMEAILGKKISELTMELFTNRLTPDEEETRIDQTAMALENIKREEEELEGQAANLIAHSGFILEKVHAAHEFNRRINEQDLLVYVRDYLESYWQGFEFKQIKVDELLFEIRLPAELVALFRDFIKTKKLFGQTRLAEGHAAKCQFVNKLGLVKKGIEAITQFHPLIRFISNDLNQRAQSYCPLLAMELDHSKFTSISPGVYAFGLTRWNFSGLREEETIQSRVVKLGEQDFLEPDHSWNLISTARTEGKDWLGAANETDKAVVEEGLDVCAMALQHDFEKTFIEKQNENYDRVSFQLRSAEKHLERQLSIQDQTLRTHEARGNLKMIPLVEARKKKIQERFDAQRAGIEAKKDLKGSPFDICSGVIRIN
jgi:SNF2 family DNA or RNA helicase